MGKAANVRKNSVSRVLQLNTLIFVTFILSGCGDYFGYTLICEGDENFVVKITPIRGWALIPGIDSLGSGFYTDSTEDSVGDTKVFLDTDNFLLLKKWSNRAELPFHWSLHIDKYTLKYTIEFKGQQQEELNRYSSLGQCRKGKKQI